MKERKGFKSFIGGLFGRQSKNNAVKERKATRSASLFDNVRGGFSARKKKDRGTFGKPGTKMGRQLSKDMRKYMAKKIRIARGRYKKNAEIQEYLKKDRYYMICAATLYGKKTA
ncbi:MAG: hypothetical protein PQJ59_16475 [Spirochaetales bacterium]|nr:hypothetical protein [Spirochaetales bacterium]